MPQFSGNTSPTNDDKMAGETVYWYLQVPAIGYTAASVGLMNAYATIKVVTLPGDLTALTTTFNATLKASNPDKILTDMDALTALIV